MANLPNPSPVGDPAVTNPAIAVDLSGWKMRQHLDWTTAGRTTNSADAVAGVLALNALMATAITAWPYAGDPRQPESYADDLTPAEWKGAVAAVESAVRAAFLGA